jgi:uncharacterized membrane protein
MGKEMRKWNTEAVQKIENRRHPELDLLRTLAIVMMILYHLVFDLAIYFRFPLDPFSGGWLILERVTAVLFLLVVGMSFVVSWEQKKNQELPLSKRYGRQVRRAAIIGSAAALVSIATYAFDPETYVRFGILHLIALCALLLPIFAPLKEGNALLAIPVFLLGRSAAQTTVKTSLLLPLGLRPEFFETVDYFPLFPWLGAILAGAAIGHCLYNRHLRLRLPLPRSLPRWALLPGRFSLQIYLLHQPLLILLLRMALGPMK